MTASVYTLHVACNDPDTGEPQGFVEAIDLSTTTDLTPILSLESYEAPLVCHFEDDTLVLGSLRLPALSHHSWVGNKYWETVELEVACVREVLAMLARLHWHFSHGEGDGLTFWDEAEG